MRGTEEHIRQMIHVDLVVHVAREASQHKDEIVAQDGAVWNEALNGKIWIGQVHKKRWI